MEELIDVLDENGTKTGLTKLRKDVHRDGDWHKVVFVFVVNNKGEIILQRRSKEKDFDPNKWTASASGHLSAGDSDIEGAIRELEEEIGIKVNGDELEYLFTFKEQYIENNIKFSHISNTYLLFKNIELEDLKLQKEEVSEAKYIHYKEFERMLTEEKDSFVDINEIYAKVLEELHKKFDK